MVIKKKWLYGNLSKSQRKSVSLFLHYGNSWSRKRGWGVWDPAMWFWYSALSIALKEHIVSWPQPQPLCETVYFFLFTPSCSSSPSCPLLFSSSCKTICKQSGSRSLSWAAMDRELLRRCTGHCHLVTGGEHGWWIRANGCVSYLIP